MKIRKYSQENAYLVHKTGFENGRRQVRCTTRSREPGFGISPAGAVRRRARAAAGLPGEALLGLAHARGRDAGAGRGISIKFLLFNESFLRPCMSALLGKSKLEEMKMNV